MRLNYLLPAEALRSQLTVHASVYVGEYRRELLPAMLPNIHIRLAGRSRYRFGDEKWRPAPRFALIGPTTASYEVELHPGVVMLTAGVLPSAWRAVVRAVGDEFTDELVDGELLWGHRAIEDLCDALCCTLDERTQAAMLEAFLWKRGAQHALPSPTECVIERWLERSESLSLDVLCDELDVTARHLRRVIRESHGMSPKNLAMKYRCLRAAATLAVQGEVGLNRALYGFADQAHLTRDFRRFVGYTPGAFVKQKRSVATATFAGRLRAGATRPLVLLS